MNFGQLQKVVFLDRDGVINEDSPDYIKNWSEFKFLPGSADAIRSLSDHGFTIIIITNQSIINRKMAMLSDLEYTHRMMRGVIRSQGGDVKDIFFCPHAPDENCLCRKPKPGLIHQAQKLYHIDMKSSCMVGDYITDFECARNAGVNRFVLVRTGRGKETEEKIKNTEPFPDYVADDLRDAAKWIIGVQKQSAAFFCLKQAVVSA